MAKITLLDGSIGQELVMRGNGAPTSLWALRVMIDQPDLLREVHEEYFRAGATIATTNSYMVHHDRLARDGLSDQFEVLLEASLQAAAEARDSFGAGRIAGALGPLVASYRPETCPPPDVAAPLYAELVGLMDPHVDLFLIETAASVEHAEGAMLGTARSSKPVWLAVTVLDEDGTKLRSGEGVEELASVVARYKPEAVLVNCSKPEAMAPALDIIKDFGLPFGAYANGFAGISDGFLQDAPTVDTLEHRTDLGPRTYAEFAMGWVAQGATIVGGCCEVGPAHIAELTRRLQDAGHEIV